MYQQLQQFLNNIIQKVAYKELLRVQLIYIIFVSAQDEVVHPVGNIGHIKLCEWSYDFAHNWQFLTLIYKTALNFYTDDLLPLQTGSREYQARICGGESLNIIM